MNIAILGGRSYVCRAMLPHLLLRSDWAVSLYTRAPDQLAHWAIAHRLPGDRLSIEGNEEFGNRDCDAIINFIGAAGPSLIRQTGQSILTLTAEWDRRVLQELRRRPSTKYLFISSGVATGEDFNIPRKAGGLLKSPAVDDYYARAKVDAERHHRQLESLSIVDLRLYSFYSADMGTDLDYLICSILKAFMANATFLTNEHDLVRDYLHPDDFAAAIVAAVRSLPENAAYDLYSLAPVRKFELLRHFEDQLDLKWQIDPSGTRPNKLNYYSEDRSLARSGFAPRWASMEAVADQVTAFVAQRTAMISRD